MRADRRPDRIRLLSWITLRKMQGLQWAIYLSLAAVACVVLAALTSL